MGLWRAYAAFWERRALLSGWAAGAVAALLSFAIMFVTVGLGSALLIGSVAWRSGQQPSAGSGGAGVAGFVALALLGRAFGAVAPAYLLARAKRQSAPWAWAAGAAFFSWLVVGAAGFVEPREPQPSQGEQNVQRA